MTEPVANRFRLTHEQRQALLDQLDGKQAGQIRFRRQHDRHQFRKTDIPVTVTHPAGGTSEFLVDARNLSAGGMSFLHSGCVHVGSPCRIVLSSTDGDPLHVDGAIASCRHVEGMTHEVGLRFDNEIDPYLFCAVESVVGRDVIQNTSKLPTLVGAALCIGADSSEIDRTTSFLEAAGMKTMTAASLDIALELLGAAPFQIVVLMVDEALGSAIEVVGAIRVAGHTGPVLRIRDEDMADGFSRETPTDAGLVRPFAPAALLHLVARMTRAA